MVADSKNLFLARKRGVARILFTALTLCLATSADSSEPKLRAIDVGAKQLQLGASYDLNYGLSKSAGTTTAVSLTHGDFNTDGFQDLVSGYVTDAGGTLALHRGNAEAYAPSSAASLAGLKQGVFPQGFVAQSSLYSVAVAPDFMVAGDFNRDGDADLVVAKRGDAAIYFLAGSRTGFANAQTFALTGGVDALAAGQIDMPDGMADLAVAISGASGASLLIYNELAGINGKAKGYKLPAAAESLALGDLDDSAMGDIAILAGDKALILHGFNQDTGAPGSNRLETLNFDFPVQALALGDFIWDRANRIELALLKADGSVQFAARGRLNTTALSVAEVRALRRQQAAVKSVALKSWQPGQGGAWNIVESTGAQLSTGSAVRDAKLFGARLSGKASDDLVIVDALTQSVEVLSKSVGARNVSKIAATSAPVAVLAMQTSAFGLNSLISLGAGEQAASVLPSAPLSTFTVNKTADTNDGTCSVVDCSLREAIGAANLAPGADSIVLPAGTYQLTIANAGGLNEDNNAQGDLDVNDALTITGAGAGTTIVRAGTTTSDGIDKVFAFNPLCLSPMATSISGVSISFGRNTQPTTATDFSFTGGGMDWCGAGNSSMTVTNAIINNNTNTFGYGGGINLDSVPGANGSAVITGTTISGNRTLSTLGSNTGGGVNLFADAHSVTITNSNLTGNTAAGEGGGMFVRHTNGGAVLVQGSNLSNNIAASRGGGISNINLGASTFTINQDSSVVSNISQGLAGLAAEGGGIYSSANAPTIINEVTITNNSANGAGAAERRGGGGIATGVGTVNVTFNRIANNNALGLGGSGIHKDFNAGTTTATNNWWGCNAGAATAPCDRAVSAGGAGVTLTSTPHLVLNHSASPSTIVIGQTSALTADFLTNSAATAIAVANLDAIIGTTHAHNNPVRGTHSATQTMIQASGTATATFTATAAGAGSSDSVVDSQTRPVAITISKANTVTTITTDNPDPSLAGGVVAVNFAVAVVAPGAGTATGNVVVTVSGGAETCTGTVAAGTCNITLTGAGTRTLSATYAGDANFNGSVDTETHTVIIPQVVTLAFNGTTSSANENVGIGNVLRVTTDNLAVTGAAATVTVTVSGGTANATDYSLTGTITIPAGTAHNALFSIASGITVTGDSVFENNDTLQLTLSAPVSAVLGAQSTITHTIVNDDTAPTLAINDVSINEGNAGPSLLSFTVTRTGLTDLVAGFTATTADGTATVANADYVALANTTSVAPGGATGTTTVSVTINGDTEAEATEQFVVNLTAPTNSTFSDSQGVGTITNDDVAPVLTINDVSITEGNSGTQVLNFTVTRTGSTASAVGFSFVSADNTATVVDNDYTAVSGTGTVAGGGTTNTTTVSVTINGDGVFENAESFFVNLTMPTNATIGDAQGIGIITNDDTAPTLAINDVSIAEGNAGTQTLVFTVTRTGLTALPASFTAATADATATAPFDYLAALVGSTTIAPGGATGTTTLTATINGDAVVEPNETFVVNLSAPANATIADNQGAGTITNDDTAGVVVTQLGGNTAVTEGGATDSYTVVLTSQPTADVTITPSTTGEVGISPASRTFTAANWNVPQSFIVTATDDAIVEGPENATITHASTSVDPNYQGASVPSVSAAITDNDSAVVAFNPVSVSQTEATSAMAFTVTLSNAVQSGVTLNVNSAFGTALAADFTPIVGGTISFAANSNASKTVNVAINNDALDENDETFTLTLSGLTATGNVSLGAATAAGTILDDDPTPTLSVTSPSLAEGNSGTSTMNFVVSLSAVSGRDVTFTRGTLNGTATVLDNDYVALAATVATIPAGQLSLTIPVTINGDTTYEGDQTFSLNITGVSNATPASISGTGTIVDDDQQPTTTTITSDVPDPSVVGQPYTVAVNVAAVTTSPLGTVTISDGSAACGPVTLTTATPPNSTASCALTTTSAGGKTLTATYTPTSTEFAASSGTTVHQVNAAATSISVSGPPRSRINQPIAFTVALSVNAPGAGSPAGTVTLSSGANSCNVTVPTAIPSCALSFAALGSRTITAAFAPSNGNFVASNSSGAGNALTLVFASSDIAVTKSNAVATYRPGELLVYTVTVLNLGPDAAALIRVRDQVPAGVVNVNWTCFASGGVACPVAGGSGNLDVTLGAFPVGGLLNFSFFGNVSGSPAQIVNIALAELPADTTIEDANPGNNSAIDSDLLELLLTNGFEDAAVSAPAGAYRLPSLALRSTLDEVARVVYVLDDANGEGLRVYARMFNGEVQYALAGRAEGGALRLAPWRSYQGEPTLIWTARSVVGAWVLEGVELR